MHRRGYQYLAYCFPPAVSSLGYRPCSDSGFIPHVICVPLNCTVICELYAALLALGSKE